MRLQKVLADAGVASRRASEAIILAGRVTVNGEVVRELGRKVDPAQDQVAVDAEPVKARRKLYLALHKPPGYVCSRADPTHPRLVAELLPREWAGTYPVGRLDRDSEGLLFLTNDGEFCLRLTHPRYGLRKKYLATVTGRIEPLQLASFTRGVMDHGEMLRAAAARLVSATNSRSVVELELAEGKNREVRRLFAAQGLVVEQLQRTQIGPIKLGELPPGKWRLLTRPELEALRTATAHVQAPPERAVEGGQPNAGRPRPRGIKGVERKRSFGSSRPTARPRQAWRTHHAGRGRRFPSHD